MALLVCPRYHSDIDGADKESIHEAAELKQVLRQAEQGRTNGSESARLEVSPLGRNQGFASVRQNQHELQVALAVRVPEDLQGSALKWRGADG